MTGLVERMARALCPTPDAIWNSPGQVKAREYFRDQARAALRECLEPTERMVEAGRAAYWDSRLAADRQREDSAAADILRSMIRIELDEG